VLLGCAAVAAANRPDGPVARPLTFLAQSGAFTCEVTFPGDRAGQAEPLLSVGTGGAGDVIFVSYRRDRSISLGWEQTGRGVVFSDPLAMVPGRQYRLLFSLGSLYPPAGEPGAPPAEAAVLRTTVLVQVDGRSVLVARGDFPSFRPGTAVIGANVVGGAVAGADFSGVAADPAPAAFSQVRAGIRELTSYIGGEEATAPGRRVFAGYPGPVGIRLRFPRGIAGRSEPLIVTGQTSAGDILYVHYENDHQLRFGFDHWLAGGPVSDPVTVDPGQVQELVVSMGSMLPPAEGRGPDSWAPFRNQCVLVLNDREVLRCSSPFYAAAPSRIFLADNPIGGSTAGPSFSGAVIRVEPVSPARLRGLRR